MPLSQQQLRDKIDNYKTQITKQQKRLEDYQDELKPIPERIEKGLVKVQELDTNLQKLRAFAKEWREKYTDYSKGVKDNQMNVHRLQEEVARNPAAREKLKLAEENLAKWRAKQEEATNNLRKINNSITRDKEELDTVQKYIVTLRSKRDDIQKKIQITTHQLELLKEQRDKAQDQLAALMNS